jgi:hypothetical protein
MKGHGTTHGMRQHACLEVVQHHIAWHTAKEREGVLLARQEMFHRFGEGKFHLHLPAVAKHHDKKAQPPAGLAYRHNPSVAPIDLRALSRLKV